MKKIIAWLFFLFSMIAVIGLWPRSVARANATLPESRDYATWVLRDPWDMSEYSDVGHFLNASGNLQAASISVADGVFHATTNPTPTTSDGTFFPLFPGYPSEMKIGKVGINYPIDRSIYKCLYFAVKMQSTTMYRVYWTQDTWSAIAGGRWQPNSYSEYQLIGMDLSATDGYSIPNAWNSQLQWKGLRLVPVEASGTNPASQTFDIDWIRLTDCNRIDTSISWTGSSPATLMIKLQGTSRWIRVNTPSPINSSPYTFDTQGLMPGVYDYTIGSSSGVITITPAPIVQYVKPSPISGDDYANTVRGNPWDFLDNDGTEISGSGATISVSGSNLIVDTPPRSPLDGDPEIRLSNPSSIINANLYRYFSFRMRTEGPTVAAMGMVARLIWVQDYPPYDPCYQVSNDIPYDYDPLAQIYTVDLYDPFQGLAETYARSGNTPAECNHPENWQDNTHTLFYLRFDPNENCTAGSCASYPDIHFYNYIDWIALTKMDTVSAGSPFSIRYRINTSATPTFYYTTDPINAPTQHLALTYNGSTPTPAAYAIYLPAVMKGSLYVVPPEWYDETGTSVYYWNTTGVTLGTYYICSVTNHHDAVNVTNCSASPVVVS